MAKKLKTKYSKEWLTKAEIGQILNNPAITRRDELMISMLYWCALRVSEMAATKIVMEYERSQGREPRDVSREGCGYDVKSGDICIKVKGTISKKSAQWVWVDRQVTQST